MLATTLPIAPAGEVAAGLREQVGPLQRRVAQLERSDAIHRKTTEGRPGITLRFSPSRTARTAAPPDS